MSLLINVVSDVNELAKMQEPWDKFVGNHSENPYVFCKFIEMYAKQNLQNWTLQLVIGRVDDRIIGIAPLMIKEKLGMRVATFVLSPYNSPDFLINERFGTEFIAWVGDYLFKTLECKVADLTFPVESRSMFLFQKFCLSRRIHFFTEPSMGRRILKVDRTWEQFENLKGGKFRREFRRTERRLNNAGSCRVSCVGGEKDGDDAFKKILKIERLSWKEIWRSKRGMMMDLDLEITWKGAGYVSRAIPDFKRTVWFLELDSCPIAYAIVLHYKRTATIDKTSYDSRYKSFYPGTYLINTVLRNLFNSGHVKDIDFITDMPVMNTWTDLRRGRVRTLSGRGILPKAIISLYMNKQIRRLLNEIASQSPICFASLFG